MQCLIPLRRKNIRKLLKITEEAYSGPITQRSMDQSHPLLKETCEASSYPYLAFLLMENFGQVSLDIMELIVMRLQKGPNNSADILLSVPNFSVYT